MNRDTIFISYAKPEDNQFTMWIYTQLKLAGYKCWCDVDGLHGGERDFSKEIQKVIEHEACKLVLVFSKNTFLKEFVTDEFELAKDVEKRYKLKDFIFPLKIDDVDLSARIGLNRINHFHFENGWPSGLQRLLRKLHIDKVPREEDQKSEILSNWAKNNFTLSTGINDQVRTYYSNWWEVKKLPDEIFVFQYSNETKAQAILEEDSNYPKIRHGNCVVAFQEQIPTKCIKHDNVEILPDQIYIVSIKNSLLGQGNGEFPTALDAQNFLKRLLKKTLKDYLFNLKLSRHKMSGKQDCFFYKGGNTRAIKVQAFYENGKTRRTLLGKYLNDFWHFGISFKVLLEPFICYSLKSHIVFTHDGFKKWDDDSKMFSARRKKGKTMFNREWRDFLAAMIYSLRGDDGKIILNLSDSHSLEMPNGTISFKSNFDYDEPTKMSRLSLLINEPADDSEFEEFGEESDTENDDE